MGAKVLVSLGAQSVVVAAHILLTVVVDAGTAVVGMLGFTGGQRALWLGNFLLVFEPEVFFALLKIAQL